MAKHTSIEVLKKLHISADGILDKTNTGILRYNNQWEYSNNGTTFYPIEHYEITQTIDTNTTTIPSNYAVSNAINNKFNLIKPEIYYNQNITSDSASGLYINTENKTFTYYNNGTTISILPEITETITNDKNTIPSNYAVSNAITDIINKIPEVKPEIYYNQEITSDSASGLYIIKSENSGKTVFYTGEDRLELSREVTNILTDSKESIPSNYAVSSALTDIINKIPEIPEVKPEIYAITDFDNIDRSISGLYINIDSGDVKFNYNNNLIDLSNTITQEVTTDALSIPSNYAVSNAITSAISNIGIPSVTPEIYYNQEIIEGSPSGLYITDENNSGKTEFYTGDKIIKLSYEITGILTNEVSTIPSNKAVYDAISGFSYIEKTDKLIASPKNKTLYVTEESDCKVFIDDEFINLSMEAVGDISNSAYQTDDYIPTVKAVVNYIASQVSNVSEPIQEIPAISNDGNPIIILSESQITPTNLSIYKYETKENDELTIDVSHLTADYSIEFQIWLDYKFACTFTNEIIWVNGELTETNKFYAIKFVWDGTKLIGQIQYSY